LKDPLAFLFVSWAWLNIYLSDAEMFGTKSYRGMQNAHSAVNVFFLQVQNNSMEGTRAVSLCAHFVTCKPCFVSDFPCSVDDRPNVATERHYATRAVR
jgi:hypothetical protein